MKLRIDSFRHARAMRLPRLPTRARTRGAALFIAVLFLMLISMLSVAAARQSVVEHRMAVGKRNSSLALASAESAARSAERWLYDYYKRGNGRALVGDAAGTQGVFDAAVVDPEIERFRSGAEWVVGRSSEYPRAKLDFTAPARADAPRLVEQPRFLIEDLGRIRPSGAGSVSEGGVSGTEGYAGPVGPSGNFDDRVYRVVAKGTGSVPGVVRTVETTFSGRAKS